MMNLDSADQSTGDNATINTNTNTFTKEEGLKIILISSTQEMSIKHAKQLLGLPDDYTSSTDTFRGGYNNYKVVIYAHSPKSQNREKQATVAVDAVVLYLTAEDEIKDIYEEMNSNYKYIAVRLIVGNPTPDMIIALKGDKFVPSMPMKVLGKNQPELDHTAISGQIFGKLFELDRKERDKIVRAFNKYDANASGFLDLKEIPNIVSDLGENPSTSELQEAMLALDINHDEKIDLNEFIQWWKIGRQNIQALSKIYELNKFTEGIISHFINLNSFQKDTQGTVLDKLSKVNISITTPNITDETPETTRLYLHFGVGGEGRKKACKNFLSRYTNTVEDYANDNWINFSFFVQSLTFKGDDIKHYLETFRENLIAFADQNFLPGLSNFIRDFVIFKFFPQDCSANIVFHFKADVTNLLKYSLHHLLLLKDWISDNTGSSFDIDIKVSSPNEIGEFIAKEKNSFDFLETSHIKIESSGLKDRLKIFLLNLSDNYQQYLPILQLLFATNTLKIEETCNIEESVIGAEGILNFNLKYAKPLINFVKQNMDPELLKCLSRLEIGMNLFDIFAGFALFSAEIWK